MATKTTSTAKPTRKTAAKPRAKAKTAAKADTLSTKAKGAYAKGAGIAAEVGAFTKANAVAVGIAGKILGTGIRQIGTGMVGEGKLAVAALKGDVAELKAIRSPVDLVRLQSKVLGRNLGAMTAFGVRHADGMIKLAEASALPIAHRLDAAVKVIKKAA